MATYAYDDFRVTFSSRPDGEYDLQGECPTGATVTGRFRLPLEGKDLERAVLGVARSRADVRTRRASAAPPDGPTPSESVLSGTAPALAAPAAPAAAGAAVEGAADDAPAPAAVVAARPVMRDVGTNRRNDVDGARLGALLADALFAGDIGQAYEAALQQADGGQHGLRLTLSLADAPALLSVPWEFLFRRPVFLASQRHTPVVRQLATGKRVPPPAIDDVVRILAVVASPKDLAPLNVEGERARVQQAVAAVAGMGRVRLDWLDPATPRGLQQALRDGNYHVLHYVGHSDFTADGDGVLFLENKDDRTSDVVDGTLLANLLSDQRMLRLVVLNSCEGARTRLDDPYAGVATTLVKLGVPAVVAMQFEISDDAAVLFAEELYANLIARQDPIDAAVAEARKAVFAEIGHGEWATPVLFVQDPDVALFHFRRDAETLPAPPAPGSEGGRTLPAEHATTLPSSLRSSSSRARRSRWLLPAVLGAVGSIALIAGLVIRAGGDDGGEADVAYPTLELGADGVTVEAAQWLLRHQGAEGVTTSGVFDHPTRDALIAFEQAANLPPDGILGPLTWSELVDPIRPGAAAPGVNAAQLLLNANGAEPRVAMDGIFGPRSQAATTTFEEAHDLPVDGIVDGEVWKRLVALAPPATVVDVPPVAPTTTAASTVEPNAPRPRSGFLAFVVEEHDGTHLITVDPADPDGEPGTATNREEAVDTDPAWDRDTNRLAFARAMPADGGDVGVFYVVPGSGPDRGKQVAPLVTGRDGSERLPQWSADGGLYFVATDGCLPAEAGCADSVRLARFDVTNDPVIAGPYLDGALSMDTLTLSSDELVAGGFDGVRAVAADPAVADRLFVADEQGVWLLDAGPATLVQPGLDATTMSFTADGTAIVVAADGAAGQELTLLGPDGAIITSVPVDDLATGTVDGVTLPAGATLRSLSPAPVADGRVAALLDDTSNAVAGVVVEIDPAATGPTVVAAARTPPVVVARGPVLAVAA